MQIAQTKTRGGDPAAEAKDSAAQAPLAASGDASRMPGYARGQDAQPAVPLFRGLGASLLQPKLAVGVADDPFEREADAVAEMVTSEQKSPVTPPSISPVTPQALSTKAEEEKKDEEAPAPTRSAQLAPEDEQVDEPANESLQKMSNDEAEQEEEEEQESARRAETVIDTSSGGEPLDEGTRARVEPRMGQDFSDVRVHADAQAAQANRALDARAFTSGSDIFLGDGESKDDTGLISHELTHVVQQGGGAPRPPAVAQETVAQETVAQETIAQTTPDPDSDKKPKGTSEPDSSKPSPPSTTNASATPTTGTTTSTNAPTGSTDTTTAQPKSTQTTPTNGNGASAPTTTSGASTPGGASTTTTGPTSQTDGSATPTSSTSAATTPTSAADAGKQSAGADGAGGAGGGEADGAALLGGGGGGGGGGTTAAEPVEPEIDASSSEALLSSLASVPASGFSTAVDMATEAAAGIQEQEKSDLESEFPEIERPTGLPSRPAPVIGAPDLGAEEGEQPEVEGEQQGAPFDTEHEEGGPVPEGPTPPQITKSQDEDEGSWWDWFWGKLDNFLSGLPTTDSGVNTSAGERPAVDLTGDADPAQNDRSLADGQTQVDTGYADADAATYEYFGEDDIYPTVPRETMRPGYTPGAPPAMPGGLGVPPPAVSADAQAAFDLNAAPHIDEEVQAQRDEYDTAKGDYEEQSEETRAEGQRRIEEENERVRGEQEGMQEEAKGLIEGERETWRAENDQLVEQFETQSEAKREETQTAIDEEVESAEEEADQKMTEAEKEADEEKRKAEEKAAEEKRKEEAKPRSWWDSVVDAIDAVFDAILTVVNAIFDALRWVVKQIIEAVKWVVRGIIELARMVIVGYIYVFAEFVKGLVDIALFAFPEQRKAAREWIDGTRDSAIETVNSAAEALKAATDAILDWVAEGLDKLLGALQALWNVALNVLRLLATGRLAELWQHLEDLGQAMWDGLGLVEGEIWKELIGFDLTKDLGPQMAGDAKEEASKLAEEEGGDPDNIAFLLQETITDDQVAVEEVAELELDEEMLDALDVREGEEMSLGTSEDPDTGTDAIMADLLSGLPQEQLPAEAEQAEQEQANIDPQTKDLMDRMATAKTRTDRLDIVKDLVLMALDKFWEEKLKPNLWWIIPAVILALAAFIAAEIFTAGAVTAAIPIILEVVAAIFLAHDIARVSGALGEYLEKGWAGDVPGAAQAFAKAIAIGIVAVIMLLLFEVGGAAIKTAFKGVARGIKAGVKVAATAAKAVARGVVKGILYIGKLAVKAAKIGAELMGRSGKFILRKGKLFFKAVSRTIGKGLKSVDDLFKKLKEFFGKFKGFAITRTGAYINLWAIFNPKVLIARAKARPRSALSKDIPGPDAGFDDWFDKLTVKQLDDLWADVGKKGASGEIGAKEVISRNIRHPGGQHEWLKVSQTPTLKRWGVDMKTIKAARQPTSSVGGKGFQHGGKGSGAMHQQLDDMFAKAKDFNDFKQMLNKWADVNYGGRGNLPPILHVP